MTEHRYAGGLRSLPSAGLVLTIAMILLLGPVSARAMAGDGAAATSAPAADDAARQARYRQQEMEQHQWEAKRAHLMDLIFANSVSWSRFEDLPPAFSEALDDDTIEGLLDGLGSPERSVDDEFLSNLRKVDLADGVGILYTGQALDREGFRTTLWPSYGTISAKRGEDSSWSVKVIRLKQGTGPRFTGVIEGCCADSAEAFYRADLQHPDGAEVVRSSKYLVIPDGTTDIRFPVVLNWNADLTLRFSPAVDDTPAQDPDAPVPAIGNVARKVNSIFDAVALMSFMDPAGKQWVLIQTTLLDDGNAHYNDPSQLPVDLGWVDASTIGPSEPRNLPLVSWLADHERRPGNAPTTSPSASPPAACRPAASRSRRAAPAGPRSVPGLPGPSPCRSSAGRRRAASAGGTSRRHGWRR